MTGDLFPAQPPDPAEQAGPVEPQPAPLEWYTTPRRFMPDGKTERPIFVMPKLAPRAKRNTGKELREYREKKAQDAKTPRLFTPRTSQEARERAEVTDGVAEDQTDL